MAAHPSAHPTENRPCAQYRRSFFIKVKISEHRTPFAGSSKIVASMPPNGIQIASTGCTTVRISWAIFHNPHERTLCGAGPIVKRPTSCDVSIEFEHFCGVPAHGEE